ncbi:MAG: hypothetical protein J6L82_00350 [Alphaproteobacteria bacterium]|nr:hypothetical protein [Alphaproteobacteria bacterium]
MRLDFKILWIDDEKDSVDTQAELIDSFLKDQGFTLEKIWAKDKETLDKLLSETKDFDFIFVDNKFNDKDLGLKFIETLRENNVYADILFFSSTTSAAVLKEEATKRSIQSIYIYTKTDINDDDSLFTNIIQYRINKEMDLYSLRGIAMSEVAEFDSKIWDMIKSKENSLKSSLASAVKKFRSDKYDEYKDKTEEKIWNDINKNGTAVFDSFHMHKFLCTNFLNNPEISSSSEAEKCKNDYHEDILKKRNALAHCRDQMTTEEQLEFRKKLIEFRKIFNTLYEIFTKNIN